MARPVARPLVPGVVLAALVEAAGEEPGLVSPHPVAIQGGRLVQRPGLGAVGRGGRPLDSVFLLFLAEIVGVHPAEVLDGEGARSIGGGGGPGSQQAGVLSVRRRLQYVSVRPAVAPERRVRVGDARGAKVVVVARRQHEHVRAYPTELLRGLALFWRQCRSAFVSDVQAVSRADGGEHQAGAE